MVSTLHERDLMHRPCFLVTTITMISWMAVESKIVTKPRKSIKF